MPTILKLPKQKQIVMELVTIRETLAMDWQSVKEIYESGIATGNATFQKETPTWGKWDKSYLSFGRLVAILDNTIVGWTALSPVSNRSVYGGVSELSVYIDEPFRNKGIGSKLIQKLISESEQNEIWTLQASVFKENTASIQLHEKNGFRIIGYRERIGKLNGVWRDNFVLERRSKIVGIY